MHTLLIFFSLASGAIIGSFLNVVIFRMNTGRTFGGRSMCLSCGKTLHAGELIPIVSYLALGGKCSACKSRISIQYPLVEAMTALMSLLFALRFEHLIYQGGALFYIMYFFAMSIAAFLLIISVYDIRHKIIPESALWCFVILSFFSPFNLFSMPFDNLHTVIMFLLSGPIVALPLYLLWLFSGGRAMGFGDVKLAVGVGYLLGISGGFTALLLGFWSGAVVSIFLLLQPAKSKISMKSEVPFGPFIALGSIIVMLMSLSISNFFPVSFF